VPQKRKILVTSALPYANNSLHMGHLVEYIQTDVWVRFQRLRGHDCIYVCASDAHGTPTMLRAEEEGIGAEELIARIAKEHESDFGTFRISVDNYLTTHAQENRELTERVYEGLVKNGHVSRKSIKQAYDETRQMFLPDRYVRGTCPVCSTPDQYGDSCENCGATYTPLDLIDPVSVVSGTKPSIRESEHLFLKLAEFEDELKDWVPKHVDASMARKLDEWFTAGLKDWDISRDSPYFGFEIPGEEGKYFYVWFDAPIGYIASFLHLCRSRGLNFDEYWGEDSDVELYHFIGKDIVYFHTLFWPAMLSGAGLRTPTGVFAHGFLTIDGQKMSKRRGTFIMASAYAKLLDPDYLRYYFASKLSATPDDIDLNFADFVAKVNSDLVGKLVNIGSRCAGFIHRLNAGRLAAELAEPALFESFAATGDEIAQHFEERNYSRAIRAIMKLADTANQYIDDNKPWLLAKTPEHHADVVAVCSMGLNLFRTLLIYLKPVVPALVERAEDFLACEALSWNDARTPLLGQEINRFEALLQRVEPSTLEALTAGGASSAATEQQQSSSAAAPSSGNEIDIDFFSKLDLRVARIIEAQLVEGADKLLQLRLDTGSSERTVFAGIRKAYRPEELIGRHIVLVANLKPRKMRFGVSEGMVLAAAGDDGGVFLVMPDAGAEPGMKVT